MDPDSAWRGQNITRHREAEDIYEGEEKLKEDQLSL
jgi:hypothetical protein